MLSCSGTSPLANVAADSDMVISGDLLGPLTNMVTVTAVPTANEPVTVTTAVSVTLESYVIFLPLVVSASVPDAAAANVGNTAVNYLSPFITKRITWILNVVH